MFKFIKIVVIFGIPARIHSDQGRSFDNEIISHLCKMHGVRQSTTTPYNPHGNSQCEWFNRHSIWTHENSKQWAEAKLASLSAITGLCLQCHSSFINRLSTIWAHVWVQGTNAMWQLASDWTITNQKVLSPRLSGWTSNWMPCCMQTSRHWSSLKSPHNIIRTALVAKSWLYQLEIMCYCVIIWKAATKYRIGTNQTYMSWLVTTRSPMFITFSFWIRINQVPLKWSTCMSVVWS